MYRLNEQGEKVLKDWLRNNSKSRKSIGHFIVEAERKADDYLDEYNHINIKLDKYETSHGIEAVLRLESNCFTRID